MQASGYYIDNLMKEIENPDPEPKIESPKKKMGRKKQLALKKQSIKKMEIAKRESLKKSIIISDNYEQYNKIYQMYKEDLRNIKFDHQEELSDDEKSPRNEQNSCDLLQKSRFFCLKNY